ncbi:hypothetical protein HDU83_001386 [Entophlyctis luteolus]|nr:hypothetical protein HDU83_001386 [Entophlyctis luteolus]KAJ3377393.1 hypothetical protein HDU84_008678 [Entophlyctis sp. JEL0112]
MSLQSSKGSAAPDDDMQRLLRVHKSIDALVDLIPAKYYIPPSTSRKDPTDSVATSDADPGALGNKKNKDNSSRTSGGSGGKILATHNAKKQAAPKQAIKEATKKAKKWKLDPSSDAHLLTSAAVASEAEKSVSNGASTVQPANSIEELRDRLRQKIAMARLKRGLEVKDTAQDGSQGESPSAASSHSFRNGTAGNAPIPRSRQEILEKRMKKRKELKEQIQKRKSGDSSALSSKKNAAKDIAAELKKAALSGEGSLDFSRISFSSKSTSKDAVTLTNGAFKNTRLAKKHDPKTLLTKLEHEKQKLAELAVKNPEKHAAVVEASKWEKATAMAHGEVVRDNVSLVKKSVKKLEKRKAKSQSEWKKRNDAVSHSKAERDKKRAENLRARAEGKKKKGPLHGVKKGAGAKMKRAGFEGRAPRR